MYFTEHFRICFHEGICLTSWTLFTLVLIRLNIYEQVQIWNLRLSLCSHSLVYLTSFVDVWDLSCLVFISAEEKKDSGVLGIILHPGATCRLCCWLNMAVVLSLLTSCRFTSITNTTSTVLSPTEKNVLCGEPLHSVNVTFAVWMFCIRALLSGP